VKRRVKKRNPRKSIPLTMKDNAIIAQNDEQKDSKAINQKK